MMLNKRITIIDYGVGNLFSVTRALELLEFSVVVSSRPDEVRKANRILLPGVGAYTNAIKELRSTGLDDAILEVCEKQRPMLGLCLGMQLMFDSSDEFGYQKGLELINGKVTKIPVSSADGKHIKIPRIGWFALTNVGSTLVRKRHTSLLSNIGVEASVYFAHSFHAIPDNQQDIIATSPYNGNQLTAIVGSDNLFGCQFHPEKSGPTGLKILSNFMSI